MDTIIVLEDGAVPCSAASNATIDGAVCAPALLSGRPPAPLNPSFCQFADLGAPEADSVLEGPDDGSDSQNASLDLKDGPFKTTYTSCADMEDVYKQSSQTVSDLESLLASLKAMHKTPQQAKNPQPPPSPPPEPEASGPRPLNRSGSSLRRHSMDVKSRYLDKTLSISANRRSSMVRMPSGTGNTMFPWEGESQLALPGEHHAAAYVHEVIVPMDASHGSKGGLVPAPPTAAKPALRQYNSARQLNITPQASSDGSAMYMSPSPAVTSGQVVDLRLTRRHSHAALAVSLGQSACGNWVTPTSGHTTPAAGSERPSASGGERFSFDPQHPPVTLGRTRSQRSIDPTGVRQMRASEGYDAPPAGPPPAASTGHRSRAPEVFLPGRSAVSFTAGMQRPTFGPGPAALACAGTRSALRQRPSDGAVNLNWQDAPGALAPEPRRVSFVDLRRPSMGALFPEGLPTHLEEEQPSAARPATTAAAKPGAFRISGQTGHSHAASDASKDHLPAIQKEKKGESLLARLFK